MKKEFYIFLLILPLLCLGCNRNKRHLVVSTIQDAAKLATTETILDKVVVGTKTRKMLGLVRISQAEFVAYTKATVKTGIDLSKLKPEDVKIEGRRIEVKLPAIQVLTFSYPFQSYEIDHHITDDDFLNRLTIYDHEEFFRKAELDIRENLKYMGIIEETEKNTRKLMRSLLTHLNFEEIYISFYPAGEDFIPQVQLPGPDSQN